MESNRIKNLETCLVISIGFLIVALWKDVRPLYYVSITVGLIGIFFDRLAYYINWLWYKISEIMGYVMSKVILSIIFYMLLTPLGLMFRFFNKKALQLKKESKSTYVIRNHHYVPDDMEHIF